MSRRNQHVGSSFQQGGSQFGDYNENYGYNDQYVSHQRMNVGYNRNWGSRGRGGAMYGGRKMGYMRSKVYGGPSRYYYMNDRMNGRERARDRHVAKSHKDSRGGSVSRRDDDVTYNPEESTDDLSDVDYDMFECWKSDDEDGERKEKNGEKETTEIQGAEKVSKTEESKLKKPFICYVCKVSCSTKERLTNHQKSKSHTSKIDELLAIRRQKKKEGREEVEEARDQNKKKSSRKPGNWCTVCECAFTGNYISHRYTKEHKKKRDIKYPKCPPCRLEFNNFEEYRDHCKSDKHKQRSAEFLYRKTLACGSDEDEAAIQPAKIQEEDKLEAKVEEESDVFEVKKDATEKEEKAAISEDKEHSEDSKRGEIKENKDRNDKEVKKSKPKVQKCVGQSFVVPVQGYYCKLCHKFFKDVTVAKTKHCRSVMHTDAFKKAMEIAIQQEEEKQKLAEEQAEAEELAAEIAAVERAAKKAAKKELAAKKASISKEENFEMMADSHETYNVDKEKSRNEDCMENGLKKDTNKEMYDSEETKDSATKDKEKDSEDSKEQESSETIIGDAAAKDSKKESTNEDGIENGLKEGIKVKMDDSEETEMSAFEDKEKDSEGRKEKKSDETMKGNAAAKDGKKESTNEDGMENRVKVEMDDSKEMEVSATGDKGKDSENNKEEQVNQEQESDETCKDVNEESTKEGGMRNGVKEGIDNSKETEISATKDNGKDSENNKKEQVNQEQESCETFKDVKVESTTKDGVENEVVKEAVDNSKDNSASDDNGKDSSSNKEVNEE